MNSTTVISSYNSDKPTAGTLYTSCSFPRHGIVHKNHSPVLVTRIAILPQCQSYCRNRRCICSQFQFLPHVEPKFVYPVVAQFHNHGTNRIDWDNLHIYVSRNSYICPPCFVIHTLGMSNVGFPPKIVASSTVGVSAASRHDYLTLDYPMNIGSSNGRTILPGS